MEFNKINKRLVIIASSTIVLGSVITAAGLYLFYPKPVVTPPAAVQVKPTVTTTGSASKSAVQAPDFAKYVGSYKINVNPDKSYDVYYGGTVQTVTDFSANSYIVTLLVQKGQKNGQTVSIIIPKSPPAEYAQYLGSDFKAVFKGGINPLLFRVRYNVNGQFIEWALV